MTPWQGAGAGQAVEDAMIMGALLATVTSADDVPTAFRAFDLVRRPRCQQILDSSRVTGQIMCGQNPDVGMHAEEIREALRDRWRFIQTLDTAAHRKDALEIMRELCQEEQL